jgi:hypothetical protein
MTIVPGRIRNVRLVDGAAPPGISWLSPKHRVATEGLRDQGARNIAALRAGAASTAPPRRPGSPDRREAAALPGRGVARADPPRRRRHHVTGLDAPAPDRSPRGEGLVGILQQESAYLELEDVRVRLESILAGRSAALSAAPPASPGRPASILASFSGPPWRSPPSGSALFEPAGGRRRAPRGRRAISGRLGMPPRLRPGAARHLGESRRPGMAAPLPHLRGRRLALPGSRLHVARQPARASHCLSVEWRG